LAGAFPHAGLVHHSDRGTQYASKTYRDALAELDIVCSMSRKGNCWDNAVSESFFSTIKHELIHRHDWETRAAASLAIAEYIGRISLTLSLVIFSTWFMIRILLRGCRG
jgi:putative transposase